MVTLIIPYWSKVINWNHAGLKQLTQVFNKCIFGKENILIYRVLGIKNNNKRNLNGKNMLTTISLD